jgi:uncharacterized RDD family membrane protein YckC
MSQTTALKPGKAPKAPKPPRSFRREFVTPEGVDLHLQLGTAADRAVALAVDLVVIGVGLLLLTLAAGAILVALLGQGADAFESASVVWLIGAFLLRNFYFFFFELRPGAATPGKRALGLRVVSRNGGRLTADAVFVRNAMRELELFVPLSFMGGAGGGWGWFGVVWIAGFLLLPIVNRDRLRAGDLVAGTMVVSARRSRLQGELARAPPDDARAPVFTSAQLDAYGVEELQLLETVLRRGDAKVMKAVAERIRARTGWSGQRVDDRAFLTAYYGGLRGRLEQRMLFGRRRKNKHDLG